MSNRFYTSASTEAAQNFNVEEYRHWSPSSQTYTSADVLQQYLRAGWQLSETVTVETFTLGAGRRVSVYRFVLSHNEREMDLPIVCSPIVLRLIMEHNLNVVRLEQEIDNH